MAEPQGERYFCPFGREMCAEGLVMTAAGGAGRCQFWERDTAQTAQCKLLGAVAGLAAISAIPGMLQSLASQGKE